MLHYIVIILFFFKIAVWITLFLPLVPSHYMQMSINPEPLQNSLVWQNMEKYKERTVVVNRIVSVSAV